MNYIFILIHGTFAKRAPWTESNSNFCKTLQNNIENNLIEFIPFEWSGRNSHKERIKAADELTNFLKTMKESSSGKKIIIIAHSHGGNIAMYALRNLKKESLHFELITMATPFLNPKKRNLKINIDLFTHILCLFLSISSIWLLVKVLIPFNSFVYNSTSIYLVIKIIVVPILIILIYFCVSGCFSFLSEFLQTKIKEIFYAVDRDATNDLFKISFSNQYTAKRHLVLVDQGDEIRFWFGILYKIWESIFDFYNILTLIGRIIYIPTNICLGIVVIFSLTHFGIPVFLNYSLYGLIFLMAILLCTIILPILLYFLKSNVFTLGSESFRHQLLIKIEPAITPLNNRVEIMQFNFKRQLSLNPLNYLSKKHSIYNQKKVIKFIANWIKIAIA